MAKYSENPARQRTKLDSLAIKRNNAQREFAEYDKSVAHMSQDAKFNDKKYMALRTRSFQAQSGLVKAYDKKQKRFK